MASRSAFVVLSLLLVTSTAVLLPVLADDAVGTADDGNTTNVVNDDQLKSDIGAGNETTQKVSYEGAQLLRIKVADDDLKNKLEQMEESGVVETWSAHTSDKKDEPHVHEVMVKGDQINQVTNLLDSNNATFEIVIDDIQTAIQLENPDPVENEDRNKPNTILKVLLKSDSKEGIRNWRPYRLTWQRYHRYTDHLEYLNYLQSQYPDLVSIIDVGNSVEGRPIKVIKISSGNEDANAMWIDGGTHAREWISPATASFIINELVENRAAHASSISNVDFYIAPVLNPDGYEYSHSVDRLWRKNRNRGNGYCSGTDLNRNWGYRWGGAGSSKQPCKEIYAGTSAFSEPETKAISNFVLSKKDKLKGYVTFHSYGQYILYPWGYAAKVPPDYADLDRVGRKAAAAIQRAGGPAYTVGNSASTLYAASGGADDWAKGVAGIKYTYTIELRDNGRYGFVLPAQFIEPCGREALAAIKVIAEEINKTTT